MQDTKPIAVLKQTQDFQLGDELSSSTPSALNGNPELKRGEDGIKEFVFGTAEYFISDGNGDKVKLKVNYFDNYFEIVGLGELENSEFRKEVAKKAKDLLKRKHGVNFAKK